MKHTAFSARAVIAVAALYAGSMIGARAETVGGRPAPGANLECPEIGSGRVPAVIGDVTGGGLFTTENAIDLANEINGEISRLLISSPDISWDNVQDVLIAAYCRVVAGDPRLSPVEKWGRMRQFTGVLQREIAAEWRPGGKLVTAHVPLAADVYRELEAQAKTSNLTAAQLMAAILARAAGR